MAKAYSFTLYKSLIYETVKNETHLSAHALRASQQGAQELAFHEEAGDEAYHERKLERELYASVDKFKSEVASYLEGSSDSISSEIKTDGSIVFTISLNDRYNSSYVTPLADLCSKYIEDNMLLEWWSPLNQNLEKVYAEHVALDLAAIQKLFIKSAPSKSSKSYADISATTA